MDTVLIIEDENIIRTNISNILRFEDFNVLAASNGREGLTLARQEVPDLIICDIMMPEMDGYEVLEKLREQPETSAIPLIFLTARADRSDMRRGMVLGADDYLTKPFTSKELLEAVRSRLQRQEKLSQHLETHIEKAKKRLIQMVAHELRTPLISLTMVQDIISRRTGSMSKGELQEFLDIMNTGTNRIAHFVEQMVFFTQIEAEILSAEAIRNKGEWVPVWSLMTGVTNLGKKYATRNRDLRINVDTQANDSQIFCALNALKHALAEILTNAINFSSGKVDVIFKHQQLSHSQVFTIQDDGSGIPNEALKIALLPFEQIDRDRHEQQGFGLGLPLANRIIELHNGRLTIEGKSGQGTTVTVHIPNLVADEHGET